MLKTQSVTALKNQVFLLIFNQIKFFLNKIWIQDEEDGSSRKNWTNRKPYSIQEVKNILCYQNQQLSGIFFHSY
jgi:hypothetical protein